MGTLPKLAVKAVVNATGGAGVVLALEERVEVAVLETVVVEVVEVVEDGSFGVFQCGVVWAWAVLLADVAMGRADSGVDCSGVMGIIRLSVARLILVGVTCLFRLGVNSICCL